MREDNTPANIVPFSGSDRKLKWTVTELPQQLTEDIVLCNSLFIPQSYPILWDNEDVKIFLKERLDLIRKSEKKFVENLGMTYSN